MKRQDASVRHTDTYDYIDTEFLEGYEQFYIVASEKEDLGAKGKRGGTLGQMPLFTILMFIFCMCYFLSKRVSISKAPLFFNRYTQAGQRCMPHCPIWGFSAQAACCPPTCLMFKDGAEPNMSSWLTSCWHWVLFPGGPDVKSERSRP